MKYWRQENLGKSHVGELPQNVEILTLHIMAYYGTTTVEVTPNNQLQRLHLS